MTIGQAEQSWDDSVMDSSAFKYANATNPLLTIVFVLVAVILIGPWSMCATRATTAPKLRKMPPSRNWQSGSIPGVESAKLAIGETYHSAVGSSVIDLDAQELDILRAHFSNQHIWGNQRTAGLWAADMNLSVTFDNGEKVTILLNYDLTQWTDNTIELDRQVTEGFLADLQRIARTKKAPTTGPDYQK